MRYRFRYSELQRLSLLKSLGSRCITFADGALAIDLCRPRERVEAFLLRKEVIQPQVPLRLPCYDFIPVTTHTLGHYFPCGLVHALRVQVTSMM